MPSAFDSFLSPLPSARNPSPFPDPVYPNGMNENTYLGSLMESSLGGLAYLGSVVDKTFGGRAVRGGLGWLTGVPKATPREILSVLPFSDALGITNPNDTIHGEDMLRSWGVLDPSDRSFLGSTLPGVAAEIALDPAMLFGAAVPKFVLGNLGRAGAAGGRGLGAMTGFDPVARGMSFATDTLLPPLRAAFDPAVHGATMGAVQRNVAPAFEGTLNTLGAPVERAYYAVNDAVAPFAQAFPGAQQLIDRAGTRAGEGFLQSAHDILTSGSLYGGAVAGGRFTPAEADEIIRLATDYAGRGRATRPAELGAHLESPELLNMPKWQTEYNEKLAAFHQGGGYVVPDNIDTIPRWQHEVAFHRSQAGLPDMFAPVGDYLPASLQPYEGSAGWARVPRRELSGASPFEKARDDFMRGIDGGRDRINELAADPRFSGLARQLTRDDAIKALVPELSGGLPLGQVPLNSPIYAQAGDLADFLGNLRPAAAKDGLFNLDWAGNVKARELDSVRRQASSAAVMAAARPEAAGGFIKGVRDFEAAGTPYVRVNEFIDKMGLTARDAATGNQGAKETIANLLGINTSAPGWMRALEGYAIPTDVARDVARMGAAWNVPEALAPIVGAYDATTNLFKSGITAPFPAFHGRNLMSGIFNMWRDGLGMGDVVRNGAEMLRIQRGGSLSAEAAARLYPGLNLTPEQATHQFLQEAMAGRVAFTRNTQVADQVGGPAVKWGIKAEDMPRVGGQVRPFADDAAGFARKATGRDGTTGWNPLGIAGVGGREADTFAPVAAGRALGNSVEDWLRGTHYMSKRLGGATADEAQLAVMKYQLDYSKLTEFERQVMKRLFPFYTFSRRNLPPLLEDLATRPAKLVGTTRVVTGSRTEGEFTPPWIAEGSSVRIPGAPDGKERYISSFGLPIEDEGFKTLGALAQGDFRRVFQQLFGMGQPLAKLPAEIATGTQMYSGRPLSELQPYEFTTLGGVVPQDYARVASQVLSNTPLSRTASVVNRFTDGRENVGADLLSFGIGSRITDVDTVKAREQAAMQLLREQLRGNPGVRASENLYIRPEDLPNVRPEDLTLYGLLRQLQARGAQRAREAGR